MTMGYRVVMFLTCWIVLWIGVGAAVGSLFGTIGTGEVVGFIAAVLTTFLWPWIVPEPIDNWMDGLNARR